MAKKLIVDLDGTLTVGKTGNYIDALPNVPLINNLRDYKEDGFYIIISTARNMRTYSGNVGKININTLPVIIQWLEKHHVPHDEILIGKPWCGEGGFYIDDRAVRPSEFIAMSQDEIISLIENK